MRKTIYGLAGSVLLAAGLIASSASAQTLEWTAGELGGGWYSMGGGLANLVMAEVPDLNIKVVPGGGKDNPSKVQAGLSQIGFGLGFLSFAAVNGSDPYTEPHDKLRSIGSGFSPSPFHLVRAKGQTMGLAEALKSKGALRIAVAKAGSSEELTFQRVMKYLDTSYDQLRADGGKVVNLNYTDMVAAFKDGQVDYLFFALGLPGAAVIEIAEGRRDAELVAYPQDIIDYLSSTYGYAKGTLPAGTYSDAIQDGDVPVPSMDTVLLVSSEVSEDVVYEMTKALIENRSKFGNIHQSLTNYDPATAWQNSPVPLHPGAIRAYKELGFMS